jgi:peptidoglycan hydrolase CwlO-like protein
MWYNPDTKKRNSENPDFRKGDHMTSKEFSRLRRQDLLELLLTQGREAKATEEQLAAAEQQCQELEASCQRFKDKLDEKDRQIDKLKARLDRKDETIHRLQDTIKEERKSRRIQLEDAGSLAEASLRLGGVFEAAQKSADLYLENIQARHRDLDQELAAREQECQRSCDRLRQETVAECQALKDDTRAACLRQTVETAKKCAAMRTDMQENCARMLEKHGIHQE